MASRTIVKAIFGASNTAAGPSESFSISRITSQLSDPTSPEVSGGSPDIGELVQASVSASKAAKALVGSSVPLDTGNAASPVDDCHETDPDAL